jgi:CheY-like chemotaxis protein
MILDIYPLKHSQSKLMLHQQQLETDIEQRTQELNEALIEAEKSRLFKTLLLNAANHDLRQPLQTAGLYLSVLSRRIESSDCKRLCNALQTSLNMMRNIIDALLDISKLENGSIQPSETDFLLSDVLNRLTETFNPIAIQKGLVLEIQTCDCILHSDVILFERILDNIVDNAIKYTGQGRVSVSCTCSENIACIQIEDTGIGIASDQLVDIFEAYYQINNPERQTEKGLGLGLAIVKYIAGILDVKLAVASTLGKGSQFYIEVPLGQTMPLPIIPTALVWVNGYDNKSPVLLIEDDASIRNAIQTLFDTQGIHGYFIENSTAALKLIENGLQPCMIICDYQLPGLNGIETVQHIREASGTDLPALILTGNTCCKKMLSHKLTNCNIISKPVETDELLSFVAAYLSPD